MAHRPKRSTPTGPPPITRAERYWSSLYGSLMERYCQLDSEWGVPMQSVKLYAKRVGLDRVLFMLTHYGTAVVAERCRHEMTLRQEFLAHMLVAHPPGEDAGVEEAVEEMAEDLAVIDSPAGALRLLRYLDRLRMRELMLNAKRGTVH